MEMMITLMTMMVVNVVVVMTMMWAMMTKRNITSRKRKITKITLVNKNTSVMKKKNNNKWGISKKKIEQNTEGNETPM